MGWTIYCSGCMDPLPKENGKWVSFDVPIVEEDYLAEYYCVDCWEDDMVEDLEL